ALLDAADARIRSLPAPAGPTVFVHGDLWEGNTMWSGDDLVAIIDWEAAGAGDPGVDLGCLRWDAALLFGGSSGDEILDGWESGSGRPARDVAYWDVVAALNTPADMSGFVPSFVAVGRTDLDGATLDARRDA